MLSPIRTQSRRLHFPQSYEWRKKLGKAAYFVSSLTTWGWKANLCLRMPPPSKRASALSCLTVFRFWFWWKCTFCCCLMGLWVEGDWVVSWVVSMPPRACPPSWHAFPRGVHCWLGTTAGGPLLWRSTSSDITHFRSGIQEAWPGAGRTLCCWSHGLPPQNKNQHPPWEKSWLPELCNNFHTF